MSRRGRHHRHDEEIENGERWLLTYADMITLLLALFIVLFAISTINQKKFLALALGLKQTFDPKPGVLPHSTGLLDNASLSKTAGERMTPVNKGSQTTTPDTSPPGSQEPSSGDSPTGTIPPAQLASLESRIQSALQSKGLAGDVDLQQASRGLVVQILADKVYYSTGSADLGPVGDQVVDTVASVLATVNYDVDVEGYTDNQPLTGGPISSNEELSALRAVNVVLRLERTDGINPSRLASVGYGDTHPVAPNDNPQDMALNRRIDIVVLSSTEAQP